MEVVSCISFIRLLSSNCAVSRVFLFPPGGRRSLLAHRCGRSFFPSPLSEEGLPTATKTRAPAAEVLSKVIVEKAWTGEPKGQDSSKHYQSWHNQIPSNSSGSGIGCVWELEMLESGSVLPGQVCRRIRRQKPDSEGANRVHFDESHCIHNQNLHNFYVRDFQC